MKTKAIALMAFIAYLAGCGEPDTEWQIENIDQDQLEDFTTGEWFNPE